VCTGGHWHFLIPRYEAGAVGDPGVFIGGAWDNGDGIVACHVHAVDVSPMFLSK
jgi:hypothetical protein